SLLEVMVVLAIILILSALILPVINQVRESARRNSCIANLRQIYAGITLYVEDHDGYYPAHSVDEYDVHCHYADWGLTQESAAGFQRLSDSLRSYTRSTTLFWCPSTRPIEDNDADGGVCIVDRNELANWRMSYVQRTSLAIPPAFVSGI